MGEDSPSLFVKQIQSDRMKPQITTEVSLGQMNMGKIRSFCGRPECGTQTRVTQRGHEHKLGRVQRIHSSLDPPGLLH